MPAGLSWTKSAPKGSAAHSNIFRNEPNASVSGVRLVGVEEKLVLFRQRSHYSFTHWRPIDIVEAWQSRVQPRRMIPHAIGG